MSILDFETCEFCDGKLKHDCNNEYTCTECGKESYIGLTDAECEASFREAYADFIAENIDDECMLREAYSNFTDSLCKEGSIGQEQYSEQDNPF